MSSIIPHLKKFLGLNHYQVTRNTAMITHEESITLPKPSGNCMNWVLGHLLFYRLKMLEHLNLPHAQDIETIKLIYDFDGAADAKAMYDFNTLIVEYGKAHQQIIGAIEQLELKGEALRGEDEFAFYVYHDSYHSGQIGLLRRLLGKMPGVIYR